MRVTLVHQERYARTYRALLAQFCLGEVDLEGLAAPGNGSNQHGRG